MIVTELAGGLGNQMFQYAIARHLAIKNNSKVVFDLSALKESITTNTPRKYNLDIFELPAVSFRNNKSSKLVSKVYSYIYSLKTIRENGFTYNPSVLQLKGNIALMGYWQNEKYFVAIEETIRNDFSFSSEPNERNRSFLQQMTNTNSVSIHFRRGDYVSLENANKFHGLCSIEYYLTSIDLLKSKIQNPHFFIFSDDIKWVKENVPFSDSHTFIEGNNGKHSFEDMRLMSSCKHNIVANSSFSWWGAWLNNNRAKIVIAPQNWFVQVTTDTVPDAWIKM